MASASQAGSRADEWGMEVLKHLVIINGAGLAGIFTLYQVNCLTRSPGPALIFIAGIVMAFIALMLGWYLQKQIATALLSFAIRWRAGQAQITESIDCIRALRPLAGVQVLCGVFSLICFVWGAGKIYLIVSSATNCHS